MSSMEFDERSTLYYFDNTLILLMHDRYKK